MRQSETRDRADICAKAQAAAAYRGWNRAQQELGPDSERTYILETLKHETFVTTLVPET